MTINQVIKTIKSSYNINQIDVDASMIEMFVNDSFTTYKSFKAKTSKKLIFGGIKNWKRLHNNLISLDEFNDIKNKKPILFVGRTSDPRGNRKFELDISNNQIIFKQFRNNHHFLKIKTSNSRLNMLKSLQHISENVKTPITYKLSNTHVYVCFDEMVLKEKEWNYIKNRIGSLDLNPNYISFTVQEFYKNDSTVIYRQIFDLRKLNNTHNSNKIKHELLEVSKIISNLVKHYKCEIVGLEQLNMVSKNHNKGKFLNRLINNTWNRNLFINNLKKNLNILGIKNQEVAPQYSSTIGCLNHPEETDSIAAALEIGRRTYMFKKKFLDKDKNFLDKDIIYPTLDYKTIRERWNSILGDYNPKRVGWVGIHNYLKEKKKLNELRFLFKNYDFSSWSCFSLKSDKSLIVSCFK